MWNVLCGSVKKGLNDLNLCFVGVVVGCVFDVCVCVV